VVSRPNIGLNIEMDKLQIFDETVRKISGFLMVCQLYIRMKMRDILVKKVGAVDAVICIRRINRYIIENLENSSLIFAIVEKFFTNLRQEFGEGNDKTMKIAVITLSLV